VGRARPRPWALLRAASRTAGGWQDQIVVRIWRDARAGKEWATIRPEPVKDKGVSRHIWEGRSMAARHELGPAAP